ncbi:uracil-DNA glycosylase [Desulfobacula sp.]
MDSDISTDPGLIKKELVRVINDFSQYLWYQKKAGNAFLGISKESETLIQNWGVITRANSFFFEGPENANIFILDSSTQFFKGESGALLKKILKAMNLHHESVFICNTDDLESVHAKIKTISPEVIITLGTKARQALSQIKTPLAQYRGQFFNYNGIKVMPTFHPSMLLKHPEFKRPVWEDMKQVMETIGLNDDS